MLEGRRIASDEWPRCPARRGAAGSKAQPTVRVLSAWPGNERVACPTPTCSSASRSSRTITLPSSSARQSAPGSGNGRGRGGARRAVGTGRWRRCSNPTRMIQALRDGPTHLPSTPTWTGGLPGCRSRLQGEPPRGATPPLGGRPRHRRSKHRLGSRRERAAPAGSGAGCCCEGRAGLAPTPCGPGAAWRQPHDQSDAP